MGAFRDARERMAGQLAQRLQKASHPRVQMALMVSATGSAGLFLDWLMLKVGVARMALRYTVAVGLAYLVFLLLIKVWLVFHRRRQAAAEQSSKSSGGSDWGFSPSSGGSGASGSSGGSFSGGGGSSGGGGASASFDDPVQAPVIAGSAGPGPGSGFSGFSGGGGGGGVDMDGDELVAIALLLVAIAAALAAAIYLVVQAPAIFGEVLLDGTLSAGLYRRLKGLEHRSWLETALRKTALPFAAVALLAGVAGHYAQKAAPEARSIGGVWRHFTA